MNSIKNQALKLSDKLYFNGYEQMSRDVDNIINAYDGEELFLKSLPVLQSYYKDIRSEEEAQAARIVHSIVKLFRAKGKSYS